MSLSLNDIRRLVKNCNGLLDNVSETEIKHYAAELLHRLKRGEDVESLALYLRRLTTTNSRQSQYSAAAHELAERAFGLFNNSR